jgi:hypothetical protein
MLERTETRSFIPAKTRLKEEALELAWIRCRASRADETAFRTVLAKSIIDQVNAGKWNRDRIVENALAALEESRKKKLA